MTRAVLLAGLMALTGCTVSAPYHAPDLPIAPAWRATGGAGAVPGQWWLGFGDPVLDRLEDQALAGNFTIEQALARVEQARAAMRGARAALQPNGEISSTASRNIQSLNSGTGQLSRYVSFYPRDTTEEAAGIGANWDLDFAGGAHQRSEAAQAGLVAAQAQLAAARLAITAELADAYAQWRGILAQSAQADALVGFLGDQARIMVVRVRTGAAAAQALDASTVRLAAAQAAAATLHAAGESQRARIAVLTGRSPSSALPELTPGAAVLTAPPDPLLGVPAAVLRHRPDVTAAEARLMAAHAGVGASLAEYYPKLSLSGVLGLDSNDLPTLATGDALFGQAAFGLHWRLFDFARIDAEVRAARGREHEALAAYRETVLRASEDIEVSFVRLAAAHRRVLSFTRARQSAAHATAISARSLAAGSLSRDGWLDAQRADAEAQQELAAAQQEENQSVIACYRALGI